MHSIVARGGGVRTGGKDYIAHFNWDPSTGEARVAPIPYLSCTILLRSSAYNGCLPIPLTSFFISPFVLLRLVHNRRRSSAECDVLVDVDAIVFSGRCTDELVRFDVNIASMRLRA